MNFVVFFQSRKETEYVVICIYAQIDLVLIISCFLSSPTPTPVLYLGCPQVGQ